MMQYYRKEKRRYIPVSNMEYREWKDGFYLVHVQQSCTSITPFPLDPAFAHVEAAIQVVEQAMVKAINQALDARPDPAPLTDAQVKAWGRFQKAMGGGRLLLWYKSPPEIVQAGIEVLRSAILARRGVTRAS